MLTQRPLFDLQKGQKHLKSHFETFYDILFEIRLDSWIQRVKLHSSSDFEIKILTRLCVFKVLSY